MISDLVGIRIERGMTQEDVALMLGVTRQRVSRMEQYDSNPRLETIRRYANAVGARIESRVTIDEWRENQVVALFAFKYAHRFAGLFGTFGASRMSRIDGIFL